MVLTRAFACAVPVVASDIPGYEAVMTEETGVLVPPGDDRALADALVALLEDEPRRARARRERAAGSRSSATRGTRSPSGSSRSTRTSPREGPAAASCGRRGRGVASCSPSSAASAPCSGGTGRTGPPSRTRSRSSSGSGWWSRSGFNLLSVVARAFAWRRGDPLGDAAAAPALPPRLLRVLGRAARERGAARPGRRARPRRRAHPEDREDSSRASGRRSSAPSSPPRVRPRAGRCFSSSGCSSRRRSPAGRSRASRSCSRSASRCSCSRSRRARHHGHHRLDGMGSVKRVVTMARLRPRRHAQAQFAALVAILGQCVGWTCQLLRGAGRR